MKKPILTAMLLTLVASMANAEIITLVTELAH